jgi:hypothetical protein
MPDSLSVEQVNHRIDAHEQVCTERYENIQKALTTGQVKLDGFIHKAFTLLLTCVGTILTALAVLFVQYVNLLSAVGKH